MDIEEKRRRHIRISDEPRVTKVKHNPYLKKAIYLLYEVGFRQKELALYFGIPLSNFKENFPKKIKGIIK